MAPVSHQGVIAVTITLFAIAYQYLLKDILIVSVGVGRVLQPLSDFPYTCRRIRHERLEGCEDLWLDHEKRALYLACSNSLARGHWSPSLAILNISGRVPGGDHVSVLDIDNTGSNGLFGLRELHTSGYDGASGDGSLDLVGFDVEVVSEDTLRLWMINHRPPVDAERNYLDTSEVGANSTIDVFEVKRGGSEMAHVKTFADEAIMVPNNVALDGKGGFVFTNDRSRKVGILRELDFFHDSGNAVHCPPIGTCHIAAASGFTYPNGLVRGSDGLFYIPSSFHDSIRVMSLQSDNTLTEVDVIHLGMPVDNLSVDANGDIWAAGFPKALQLLMSQWDPHNRHSPSALWRIRREVEGYSAVKVVEDRDSEAIGGVTTVVHDVKTGRLFMGGAIAPYISVCEPN